MNCPGLVRRRRVAGLAGACALALGSLASAAIAGAGPANAVPTPCAPGTLIAAGTGCTITGTAGLSGALSVAAPATLVWSGSAAGGSTAYYVDTQTGEDQTYSVDDETESGAGWNVNAFATSFVNEKGTTDTNIALSTDGSTALAAGAIPATTPTETLTCDGGVAGPNCVAPADTLSYPVTVTGNGTTGVPIYNAAAGTGEGAVDIGGSTAADPVGWWITVPTGTQPGIYTTTITMEISSGPGT